MSARLALRGGGGGGAADECDVHGGPRRALRGSVCLSVHLRGEDELPASAAPSKRSLGETSA